MRCDIRLRLINGQCASCFGVAARFPGLNDTECATEFPAVKNYFDFPLGKLLLWRCIALRLSVPLSHTITVPAPY